MDFGGEFIIAFPENKLERNTGKSPEDEGCIPDTGGLPSHLKACVHKRPVRSTECFGQRLRHPFSKNACIQESPWNVLVADPPSRERTPVGLEKVMEEKSTDSQGHHA
jgi:hypothetical protein